MAMALLVVDRFVLGRNRSLAEIGLYSFAYTPRWSCTTRYILHASTTAAVANLALDIWWISEMGGYGAPYATPAGCGIEAAGMYFFAQRILPLPHDRKRIAVAMLIFTLVLTLTQCCGDIVLMAMALVTTIAAFAVLAGRNFVSRYSPEHTAPGNDARHSQEEITT